MEFMVLIIIYWIAVAIIFFVGLVMLIVKSSKNLPLRPALNMLIISVVMLVIGVGACAVILSGLGGMR